MEMNAIAAREMLGGSTDRKWLFGVSSPCK